MSMVPHIQVYLFEDLVERRERRGVSMRVNGGGDVSLARVIEYAVNADRSNRGRGAIVPPEEGGRIAVLVNGKPVEAPYAPVRVAANATVMIAPAPPGLDGGTLLLVALAIASTVASAALATRVKAPRVSSTNEGGVQRYGFSRYSSDAAAGDVIPIVLGRARRFGGRLIAKVPGEGADGDSRVKLLVLLSEGEIAAIGNQTADFDRLPSSAVTGIYLNDQPIANFPGCVVSGRMGTPTQGVIPGFGDVEVLRDVGVGGTPLRNTSGTERTGGSASGEAVTYSSVDAVNAAVLRVALRQGLYSLSPGGQVNTRRVRWRWRWRLSAGPGAWSAWTVETVDRAEQSPFVVAARADGLVAAAGDQIDLQAERVSIESGDIADVDALHFDSVVEVRYGENTYADLAVLAIELTASEQLTSVPSVSADVDGYKGHYVHDGSSPPSAPVWTTAWTRNPADQAVEIITNPRWGMGARYGIANVDVTSLLDFREHCAELVPAAAGTRPRFNCDLGIDTGRDAVEWLRAVCATARCIPVCVGDIWRFVVDRQQDVPVETFGDGDIALDDEGVAQFKVRRELTDYRVRPNQVAVQFANMTDDGAGRPDLVVFPEVGEHWLGGGDPEPVRQEAIRLDGVTDPEQASVHARYLMRRIRGLSRTVEFTSSRPAIVVQPGDRFDLAMSLPGWALASGRLLAGSSLTSVALDRTVTLSSGTTYVVRVTHADGQVEDREIAAAPGTYARGAPLPVDTPWSQEPAEHASYALGKEGVHVKPFTCTGVRCVDAAKLLWAISGLEYAEDVYDDSAVEVELPDYSELTVIVTPPGPVLSLTAVERVKDTIVGGGSIRSVELAWQQSPEDAQNTATFKIFWRLLGTTTWVLVPQASPTRRGVVLDLVDLDRAYQFVAVAVSQGGASLSPYDPRHPIATVVYGLAADPPPPPASLTITPVIGNTYTLTWPPVDGAVAYQVLAGGDSGTGKPNNGAEDCLVLARTQDPELAGLELPPSQMCRFYVRSINLAGRMSWTAVTASIATPATPGGQSIKQTRTLSLSSEGSLTNLAWNATTSRLEIVDPDADGVYLGPVVNPGSVSMTELTFRPGTANDADDPTLADAGLAVPSVAADQWGVVSTSPFVVGMLMPPYPDEAQSWLFEFRTHDGAVWGDWAPLEFCAAISRVFGQWQVRATLSRAVHPYKPALRTLVVVLTH